MSQRSLIHSIFPLTTTKPLFESFIVNLCIKGHFQDQEDFLDQAKFFIIEQGWITIYIAYLFSQHLRKENKRKKKEVLDHLQVLIGKQQGQSDLSLLGHRCLIFCTHERMQQRLVANHQR